MDTQTQLETLALIVALLLALLAASAETALTSVSRLRVRRLAQEQTPERWAATVARMHDDPNTFLSTILVVNTAAITFASVSAAAVASHLWHINPFVVSLVMTVILLEVAELAPKTFAVTHAEAVARVMARPVATLSRALRPLIWVMGGLARNLLRPVTRQIPTPRGPFVSEEELRYLLNVSEEQGVLEEEEVEVIHRIFEIGDMVIREVMVPRPDVIAVEVGSSREKVIKAIMEHGHTRIPVFQDSLDNIVGIIHAKDMLRYVARERGGAFDVRVVARPAHFAPESKKLDETLHEMQATKTHMFVVVDEHGGTAGIVTIEDILEQIVGEIRDEYDQAEEEDVQLLSDREALLNGGVPIDELCKLVGANLESDHYDTVAGFVISEMGHIPNVGDELRAGDARMVVEAVKGHRVQKVRVLRDHPFEEARQPAPEAG